MIGTKKKKKKRNRANNPDSQSTFDGKGNKEEEKEGN